MKQKKSVESGPAKKFGYGFGYGTAITVFLGVIVLAGLAAVLLQTAPQQQTQAEKTVASPTAAPSEGAGKAPAQNFQEKVVSILAATQSGAAMLERNASVSAFFVNATALRELAVEKPVIYGKLGIEAERNGVFEAQASSGGAGLLVIIGADAEGEPTGVLREFPVTGINLD